MISNVPSPDHERGLPCTSVEWSPSWTGWRHCPTSVLDAKPSLRVRSTMLSLTAGRATGVEEQLQAAEVALQDAELDGRKRDLVGRSPQPGHDGGLRAPAGGRDRQARCAWSTSIPTTCLPAAGRIGRRGWPAWPGESVTRPVGPLLKPCPSPGRRGASSTSDVGCNLPGRIQDLEPSFIRRPSLSACLQLLGDQPDRSLPNAPGLARVSTSGTTSTLPSSTRSRGLQAGTAVRSARLTGPSSARCPGPPEAGPGRCGRRGRHAGGDRAVRPPERFVHRMAGGRWRPRC